MGGSRSAVTPGPLLGADTLTVRLTCHLAHPAGGSTLAAAAPGQSPLGLGAPKTQPAWEAVPTCTPATPMAAEPVAGQGAAALSAENAGPPIGRSYQMASWQGVPAEDSEEGAPVGQWPSGVPSTKRS